MIEIRLLYFEGCPNVEPTYNILKECLDQEKVDAKIVRIQVRDEIEAKHLHFLGSPSIQINGEDIELSCRNAQPFFGCRIYDRNSPNQGVPPKQLIIDAIRRSRSMSKINDL